MVSVKLNIFISYCIYCIIIDNREDSQLNFCTFIPPSDITAIPQQYMVQMVTSVFPPSRLASFISCDGSCGDGVTLGESYYTLIDLADERYQFTVPVTWSANSTSNTVHDYRCRVRFGGAADDGVGDTIESKDQLITGMFLCNTV